MNERFEWKFDSKPGAFHTLKYKKRAPDFEKMVTKKVINPQDLIESSPPLLQTSDALTETNEVPVMLTATISSSPAVH